MSGKFLTLVGLTMTAGFGGTMLATAPPQHRQETAGAVPVSGAPPRVAAPLGLVPPAQVYYRRCDEARAAGAAPIYRGEPGYRPALDRDDDGIACEPWRGR